MIRACVLAIVTVVSVAEAAKSDLFRCFEADGSPRFSDRPEACEKARPYLLRGRTERVPTSDASPGSAAPFADGTTISRNQRLDAVLPAEDQVRVAWDVVREAPGNPEEDPDLVRWGVRAQLARHYTRHSRGVVQVCSIEVWDFENIPKARTAHENFAYPGWRIAREGSMLLMTRGVTRTWGEPARRGVFAACQELGDQVRERARRLVNE